MASIDSSAPETTSSDNSPTVARRTLWLRPGSDSGSSGESSDSFASSSSGDKALKTKLNSTNRDESSRIANLNNRVNTYSSNEPVASTSAASAGNSNRIPTASSSNQTSNINYQTNNMSLAPNIISNQSKSLITSISQPLKPTRFKNKRIYPSLPNQPSEASAHFMFELAKTVLTKAGGNSTTAVLFTQQTTNQNHIGPHRALHLCAFQIGVYALGLHNAVSPNWLSRTYSSNVSWITGQAMEIGAPAINFLIDTWEDHLTPTEVANLADRVSRGRDPAMVRAATKLALSCLPHAHALNQNEIHRALVQCKEYSNDMLEEACLSVEGAAKGGGVCPDVLFYVARKWYELYEESIQDNNERGRIVSNNRDVRNRTSYVQASIGEFQVPSASTNSPLGPNYPLINDSQAQPQNVISNSRENQSSNDGNAAIAQNAHSSNLSSNLSPLSISLMPPLSCTPPAYSPYGHIPGIHTFGPPISIHPAFFQTAPSSTFQYSPYFNPTPPAANGNALAVPGNGLPHFRNSLAPNAIFHSQAFIPNVVVTQPPPPLIQMINPSNTGPIVFPIASTQQAGHILPQPSAVTLAHQPPLQPTEQLTQKQFNYLLSAYRVAILAMEALGRKIHDERPQTKYSRNPTYADDVKWLLNVVKKLGELKKAKNQDFN